MSWKGAGVGAAIGAFLGGPVGAGIGAAIGHYFTQGSDGKYSINCPHCNESVVIDDKNVIYSCPHCHKHFLAVYNIDEDEINNYLYLTLLGVTAKIAKIDGRVSKNEAQLIKEFLDGLCETPNERELAKEFYKKAKDDDKPLKYYAELLYSQFVNDKTAEHRENIYSFLFQLASADGGLEEVEKDALLELLEILKLDRSIYQNLYDQFVGDYKSLDEYYKILECDKDATDAEIKRAYHQKVAQYHPDRLAAKDLPEPFIKFANEQMNLIREAYENIMASRRN